MRIPRTGAFMRSPMRARYVVRSWTGMLEATAEALRLGRIVALKGIGGFQLLVDARQPEAVARLRQRKHREEKPFALMMPSLEKAREYCEISAAEEELLESQAAPIVLLQPKPGTDIAANVAHCSPSATLPYSPLHHQLMHECQFPLIATSGNRSDEPIAIANDEAAARLKDIADHFLMHNRPIVRACDDSVVRLTRGRAGILRRARGYAPLGIRVGQSLPAVLAVGGHLKNTVAIGVGQDVFLSQHIGDLETIEARGAFEKAGFAGTFLLEGRPPQPGSQLRQAALAVTLRTLAAKGFDKFYRGELAESIAQDLATAGSPLTLADLNEYYARECRPLVYRHQTGELYNMTPPTQGLVSLLILAILDKLDLSPCDPEGADYVHLVVEATKQAFLIRDRYITDPSYMTIDPQSCLADEFVSPLANAIKLEKTRSTGRGQGQSDTVWMGIIDEQGCAVSFIQSVYHEFGSGVVLPATGITWQNRGCSFSLRPGALNLLSPRRKPFHTLNPALARFKDGRTMVYGSMGGDGQPQTQAAVFTRYAIFHQPLQHAISSPRWLFGRTGGKSRIR